MTKNVLNFIIVNAILSKSRLRDSLDFTSLNIRNNLSVLNADRFRDIEVKFVNISSVMISIKETITITMSKMLKNSSEYLSNPKAKILIIASQVNMIVKI